MVPGPTRSSLRALRRDTADYYLELRRRVGHAGVHARHRAARRLRSRSTIRDLGDTHTFTVTPNGGGYFGSFARRFVDSTGVTSGTGADPTWTFNVAEFRHRVSSRAAKTVIADPIPSPSRTITAPSPRRPRRSRSTASTMRRCSAAPPTSRSTTRRWSPRRRRPTWCTNPTASRTTLVLPHGLDAAYRRAVLRQRRQRRQQPAQWFARSFEQATDPTRSLTLTQNITTTPEHDLHCCRSGSKASNLDTRRRLQRVKLERAAGAQ